MRVNIRYARGVAPTPAITIDTLTGAAPGLMCTTRSMRPTSRQNGARDIQPRYSTRTPILKCEAARQLYRKSGHPRSATHDICSGALA